MIINVRDEKMTRNVYYNKDKNDRIEIDGTAHIDGYVLEKTIDLTPELNVKRKYVNKINGAELICKGIVDDADWEEQPLTK